MKVIINKCYGGFGLSNKAIIEYAKLKGIKLYSEETSLLTTMHYTIPIKEYKKLYEQDKKKGNWKKSNAFCFSYSDIERNDPLLVKVVESLGEEANGRFAELKIVEIPDGIKYSIEEYDGMEHIAEEHHTWS